jgi:dihydrodipicolinate synthase/N-acetylneuraminate lyase
MPEPDAAWLRQDAVIPAHPLALDADGSVDWGSQRALTRYYVAAGAHGLAVGVHTTQFALHDDPALLRDVWAQAAEVVSATGARARLVAGVCGDVDQAVAEAEAARSLGYEAALVSTRGHGSHQVILDVAAAVGEVLPTIGFYMQDVVGGSYLPLDFWRSLFAQPALVAVKVAPFNRYRTGEVVRALLESGRTDVGLLTGNDDSIVSDLVTTYGGTELGGSASFTGSLLGQWAVGTRAAVRLSADAAAARRADSVDAGLLTRGTQLTEINGTLFDAENNFAGCVAGVNELLRQQGLISTSRCLDPRDRLSTGQAEAISQLRGRYPELLDEEFIAERLDAWRS